MDLKKAGCKKMVIVIPKEKRPGFPLFFATSFFQVHILDMIFFQGHKPTHVFKTRKVGADWLGNWHVGILNSLLKKMTFWKLVTCSIFAMRLDRFR